MRLRSFLCVCLLGIVCGTISGEEAVLVPREVFVGDRAQLTFTVSGLELPKGTLIELPVSEIVSSFDATLESVLVTSESGRTTVSVFFIPWKTGTLALPSFVVEKVTVVPPEVRISSIIEKTGRDSLEPPRPPLLVPGTTWLVYGYIAAVVLVLVVSGVVIVRFVAWVSADPRDRRSARYARYRTRILLRSLKSLEKQACTVPEAVWYGTLSHAFRVYLGCVYASNPSLFASATRGEIVEQLSGLGALVGALVGAVPCVQDIDSFLLRIDLIRFSAPVFSGRVDERLEDCALVRALAERIEKELSA
ncbi:MAG TPA: BatD family protein [Treponemataceae bacterium]|jgi:hypothetical protein|nr:BatD family protein [Treponemataceae bacterium]